MDIDQDLSGTLAKLGYGQQLLDLVPVALVAVDGQGRIEWINRTALELLEQQPAVVLHSRALEMFATPEDSERARQVFESGSMSGTGVASAIPVRLLDAGGNTRVVNWHVMGCVDAAGVAMGCLCMGEEVTETMRMRAQLAQSDRMATVGMLAAGVAHEINNPLTAILFNLQLVTEDLPRVLQILELAPRRDVDEATPASSQEAPPPLQEGIAALISFKACIEDATQAAERVRDIVRDLKVFSRAEEDRLALLDVRGPIETAISMAYHEIKYRARLVKDLPQVPLVLANDGRLAQVFLNLLVNAAQAIQEGDAKNQQIVLRARSDGSTVEVTVSDTGQGIPAEHLPRMFEPFFTTKPAGIGSGLGLAICKSIVETMGGVIAVSSEPGKGATFHVRLPVGKTRPRDVAMTSTLGASDLPRSRVLVVDDDPLMRSVLNRVLGAEHEVVVMESGQQALQLLDRDAAFDVILCDIMMPTVTGVEVLDQISRRHPELVERFVFMTGGIFTPHTRESLKLSQRPTIEKPFSTLQLRKLIGEITERCRAGAVR